MDSAHLYLYVFLQPGPLSAMGSFIAMITFFYFVVREEKEGDPGKKIILLMKGLFWFFGIYTLALLLSLKVDLVLQTFGYPAGIGQLPSHPSNQELGLHLLRTKMELERITTIVSYFISWLLGCFIIAYIGIARILKRKGGQPESGEGLSSSGIS
jgi:hypothetical protein